LALAGGAAVGDAEAWARRGIGVGLDDELCANCLSLTSPNVDALLDDALQR